MYYLFRIAILVFPRIPLWLLQASARGIGWLVWLLARKARKQATTNMIHVLGPQVLATQAGRKRLRHTVQAMFQYNVQNYLEVCVLPALSSETLLERMQVEGFEHLDAALARGKGIVLFSAHFGPFDYLAQLIAIKGYNLTIPVERLQDQRMLDLMLKLRRSHGVQYIPLSGSATMRTLIQKLRDNQVVLITADRAVQGQSVEVSFFSTPARLPVGPVRLAQRTGAALIGAFGWRVSATYIEGRFFPLSLDETEEQPATTEQAMHILTENLEEVISAHPEQWLVFAPIWPD